MTSAQYQAKFPAHLLQLPVWRFVSAVEVMLIQELIQCGRCAVVLLVLLVVSLLQVFQGITEAASSILLLLFWRIMLMQVLL